jgi:hypothetical protein
VPSLVIKAGIFPEWNMATLPPWFAYVPANVRIFADVAHLSAAAADPASVPMLQLDFSDLASIMAL